MPAVLEKIFSIHAIGWTLVHSVWLGVACWVVHVFLQMLLRNRDSRVRYLAACATLLLLVLSLALAWGLTAVIPESAQPLIWQTSVDATAPRTDGLLSLPRAPDDILWLRWLGKVEPWLPWVVALWALGLVVHLVTTAWGIAVLHRRATRSPLIDSEALLQSFSRLVEQLLPGAHVLLRQSISTKIPATFGWLRPVVLLPFGLLGSMSVHEIECILAHELAHVRRRDYLIHLAQAFIETAMFYHPLVRRVSASIRVLREECCDDMAIDVLGSQMRKTYVAALIKFEKLRGVPAPRIVQRINGDGSIDERVERLVRRHGHAGARRGYLQLLGALLAIGLCGSTAMGYVRVRVEEQAFEAFAETHSLGESLYRVLGVNQAVNPHLVDAVCTARSRLKQKGSLTHDELRELADVINRGGSARTLLYAMTPSYGAASSLKPLPGSEWKGGNEISWANLAKALYQQALDTADPRLRLHFVRAAALLAAQDSIRGTTYLNRLIAEPAFPETSGLSRSAIYRLRLAVSIDNRRRVAYQRQITVWEVDSSGPLPEEVIRAAPLDAWAGWYLENWRARHTAGHAHYAEIEGILKSLPYAFGSETRPIGAPFQAMTEDELEQRMAGRLR